MLDVNDNTPDFGKKSLSIDIPENTPLGTRRKLPEAVDADLGAFGTQNYRILNGNEAGLFQLEVDDSVATGPDLVVKGDLDREKQSHHDLQVRQQNKKSPLTYSLSTGFLSDTDCTYERLS